MGKWSDLARQRNTEIGTRDNRDAWDTSHIAVPIVPNGPIVPASASARDDLVLVPQNAAQFQTRQIVAIETLLCRDLQSIWRQGIGSLDPEKPRGGFHWRRWDHLVADCVLIFNEYGELAAATGWTAEDLFGVDPAGAGGSIVGGLAWRLEGRKLLSVETGMATFKYHNGDIGRCSRGWVRGLVPVWELSE